MNANKTFNLSGIFHIVLVGALLCLPLGSLAASLDDVCYESPTRQIIDKIMNRDFADARSLLQEWQTNTPDSAEALFYSATIDMAEAKTQRKAAYKQFNAIALEKLERVKKQLRTEEKPTHEQTLVLGMSEAFIARQDMENERWSDAYKVGRQARNRLRKLLETSPSSEDANLVLGLYEFYTGDVPITLRWLTYLIDLSGNRKTGIELLEHSVEHASTAAPEAARTLLDELDLSAPEICQWLPLNETMQQHYPNNPRFAWRLQNHYRECGFPEKALQENMRATRQFAGFSSTRLRLLADRGRIYRDLGNVEKLETLRRIQPPLKNLDKWLSQARYIKGNKSGTRYTPPKTINNAKDLVLHKSCETL